MQKHRLLVPLGNFHDIKGHCCAYFENLIFVFFGDRQDDTSAGHNSILTLDRITEKWNTRTSSQNGEYPTKKWFSSSVVLTDINNTAKVVSFGGKDDKESKNDTEIYISGISAHVKH